MHLESEMILNHLRNQVTENSSMMTEKSEEVQESPEVIELVKTLGLIPHEEGGYFKEVYRSGSVPGASMGRTDLSGDTLTVMEVAVEDNGATVEKSHIRNVCTSIYYMLTRVSPIGRWHKNRSDIVHYYHGGSTLTYYLISPDGKLHEVRLGSNIAKGEVFQFVLPGGWWKATILEEGNYALVGESVAPGFDSCDRLLADEGLAKLFPHLEAIVRRYLFTTEEKKVESYDQF